MNNVFVYCEMDGCHVADVSLELLTKGRKLANELGCQLEAICAGTGLEGVEKQVMPFGVDRVHVFDAPGLFPYTSLPHTSILVNLFKEEKPQICLMGATVIGRDLGPRVSSALTSGLTADCTQLEIGSHEDKKLGKTYENLLYQIRPAFGGNIVATIVNPEHRPQMATVREGVMKKEILDENYQGEVIRHDVAKYVPETDYVVKVIDRHVEKAKHNLKGAPIVVAGGYGLRHAVRTGQGTPRRSRCQPCRRRRRLCRPRPSDWPDRCYGSSQTVHRLRHLRPDPAHRRHAGCGYHHLHQQR